MGIFWRQCDPRLGGMRLDRDAGQRRAEEWIRAKAVKLRLQEQLGGVVAEISHIDSLLGDWSARLPDGAPAPLEALRLMDGKALLDVEMRRLATLLPQFTPPGHPNDDRPPGLLDAFMGWLRRRK